MNNTEIAKPVTMRMKTETFDLFKEAAYKRGIAIGEVAELAINKFYREDTPQFIFSVLVNRLTPNNFKKMEKYPCDKILFETKNIVFENADDYGKELKQEFNLNVDMSKYEVGASLKLGSKDNNFILQETLYLRRIGNNDYDVYKATISELESLDDIINKVSKFTKTTDIITILGL